MYSHWIDRLWSHHCSNETHETWQKVKKQLKGPTLTLTVLVTTIDALRQLWNRTMSAQCEGMGEVGSARYESALLSPCPSIRVLSYSNCQEIHSRQQTCLAVQALNVKCVAKSGDFIDNHCRFPNFRRTWFVSWVRLTFTNVTSRALFAYTSITFSVDSLIFAALLVCELCTFDNHKCHMCSAVCIHVMSITFSWIEGHSQKLMDGWMDEGCFRPLLCTVKAELVRGQTGLMRWIWDATLSQSSIDRSTFYSAAHRATKWASGRPPRKLRNLIYHAIS